MHLQGHTVVVFTEDGNFVRRIGCENITNFPNGIDISGEFFCSVFCLASCRITMLATLPLLKTLIPINYYLVIITYY